jgi:L-aspartate oxidase
VTSSGLHGANRLASNSLLEGLVFGSRAADDVSAALEAAGPRPLEVPPVRVPAISDRHAGIDLVDLRESLRALMWRRVGITRDEAGLKEASDHVEHWGRYILPLEFDDPGGWTMQNMLLVARLMIMAADLRRESRGVHYRRDFPDTDPQLNDRVSLRAITPDPDESRSPAVLDRTTEARRASTRDHS